MQPIRIVIADEHSMFREAIKVVLGSEGDVEVVGQAKNRDEVVTAVREHSPDLAIVDAALPGAAGQEVVELVLDASPGTGVLVLAGRPDEQVLADVIEAGATGYVSKEAPLTELLDAARKAARGEVVVPSGMLGGLLKRLLRRRREDDDVRRRHELLTKREREVLALLATGAGNEEIASSLVISPQTARTHVQNVLGKLGVHSRLEAASLALRSGLARTAVGS